MTPSAARGVLEAIYWKPQIRWVIDEIHILNPIRFTSIRRNEVGSKMKSPTKAQLAGERGNGLGLIIEEDRQQRASLVLKDVAYLIVAHFEPLDESSPGKHLDMFSRRARSGQYFHHPYLGTREFQASFELVDAESRPPASKLTPDERSRDLGFILHDIEFELDPQSGEVVRATPRFFRAVMVDGKITVPPFHESVA
jgi:CRISPR-associated protein Cas5d